MTGFEYAGIIASLFLAGAFIYVLYLSIVAWYTKPPALWLELLERHGLHSVEDHYKGVQRGFEVKLHAWFERRSCRLRVTLQENPIFELRGRTPMEMLRVAPVVSGDPNLDRAVFLRGAKAGMLPVLDATAREKLRSLAKIGGTIEMGQSLALEVGTDARIGGEIDLAFDLMLDLAERLRCPSDQVPGRLARLVSSDPVELIRAMGAIELAISHPEAPETLPALEVMAADPKWPDGWVMELANQLPSLRGPRLQELQLSPIREIHRFAERAHMLVTGGGGHLSLSAPEGGQLSVAEQGGELSMPKAGGELSDPDPKDR